MVADCEGVPIMYRNKTDRQLREYIWVKRGEVTKKIKELYDEYNATPRNNYRKTLIFASLVRVTTKHISPCEEQDIKHVEQDVFYPPQLLSSCTTDSQGVFMD
ncbi:unnamed protein product [Rhizophagus irregularis]|nr:unnamed protein product [Rhizophagus irregularis]